MLNSELGRTQLPFTKPLSLSKAQVRSRRRIRNSGRSVRPIREFGICWGPGLSSQPELEGLKPESPKSPQPLLQALKVALVLPSLASELKARYVQSWLPRRRAACVPAERCHFFSCFRAWRGSSSSWPGGGSERRPPHLSSPRTSWETWT